MDMDDAILKIEDAISGASEDSVAEWLERIRHELMLANAIKLMELRFVHGLDQPDLIHRYIQDGFNIIGQH